MIGRTHISWWYLSLFESSSHSIKNRVGQHTSLIDQGTVNSTVNHVLKFTRMDFKSNLPRHRQCFLLDHLTTPVDTEGFQAKLHVVLHVLCHSLLLLISEIGVRHGDNVLQVEIGVRTVVLDLESVPPGMPKDVLMQKQICKHKGLILNSNIKACQPILPYNRQRW